MRTIRTKVYQFNELSNEAKEVAINWYLSGNNYSTAWDDIKQDAKEVGLKQMSTNLQRKVTDFKNRSFY